MRVFRQYAIMQIRTASNPLSSPPRFVAHRPLLDRRIPDGLAGRRVEQLQQISNRPVGAKKRGDKKAAPAKDCGPVRKSMRGRWRALSLLLVHLAVAIH